MHKLSFYTCLAALFLLSACGSHGDSHSTTHDHEGHSHTAESHEGHRHEGHNHEADAHEGHNHEGHSHETDAHQGHDHEGTGHSDEIILSPEKAQAVGVVVEIIAPTTFHRVIRTNGQVMAAQGDECTIVATTSGVVNFNRQLTEGMSINKGESLLVISAGHLTDGDPMEKAKVNFETAQKEYERMKRLVADRIVSAKEFEQAQQAYENARIAYEATAAHHSEGGQRVVTPMAGAITQLQVKAGEYVTMGQPLATISQNRKLYLRADVAENHYASLRTIHSANFRTAASRHTYTLDELNGRLISFGKAQGSRGNYLPITFEMEHRGDIIPGSYAEIWLLSSPIEHAIVLPKTALTEEQGSFFVYLQVDEEGYKKQLVEVDGDNGTHVRIVRGIHAGERVVTQGANQVRLAATSNAIPAHSHEH